MGKTTKPSASRLREILKRQDPPSWGPDYVPAIRATREEAPSRSRPSQIWSEVLQRYVHALSFPEKCACLTALFHPGLFEMQEERMLHYLTSAHPLDSHVRGAGVIRPVLRGTLEISDALGLLMHHAMVPKPATKTGETAGMMPFPFIGDILLFLLDDAGPYCVNWTVKETHEDFERAQQYGRPSRYPEQADAKEKARHQIEAVYYLDGDIRTQRLVRADFDKHLMANLEQLILWSKRKHSFAEDQLRHVTNCFKAAIGTSAPAMALVFDLARIHDCETYDIKIALHQAIWARQLRIDLFQPFHIDKPLLRERRDPLEVYAHWFARA
jgi:hypothetical protein